MPSERPIDLALRLAKLRRWNQTEFAAAIGTTSAVVSNWKNRGMPAEHHRAVAEALGITVDQLLGLTATSHDFDEEVRPPQPAPQQRTISESQWALLEDFEMLPDDEKQALRTTLKAKADHVRKIVAEYLSRKGVTGTATDARVAESFGSPPAPSPPPKAPEPVGAAPAGPGSWKKITPVPSEPPVRKHKEK